MNNSTIVEQLLALARKVGLAGYCEEAPQAVKHRYHDADTPSTPDGLRALARQAGVKTTETRN